MIVKSTIIIVAYELLYNPTSSAVILSRSSPFPYLYKETSDWTTIVGNRQVFQALVVCLSPIYIRSFIVQTIKVTLSVRRLTFISRNAFGFGIFPFLSQETLLLTAVLLDSLCSLFRAHFILAWCFNCNKIKYNYYGNPFFVFLVSFFCQNLFFTLCIWLSWTYASFLSICCLFRHPSYTWTLYLHSCSICLLLVCQGTLYPSW